MADAGSGRQRKGGFSMNKIITISRQFGSGGRELGCRLADQLGAAYYDQEIIIEISKRTRLSEQYIQNVMGKAAVYRLPDHRSPQLLPSGQRYQFPDEPGDFPDPETDH